MGEKTAPELAREKLKQLIVRKLAPTPANYQAIFNEIGGLPNTPPFPVEQLRKVAHDLPAKTPGQQKQRALFDYAITQLSWEGVSNALVAYGSFSPRGASEQASGFGTLAPAELSARGDATAGNTNAPALTSDFLEQIARLIEFSRPALGTDDTRFSEQTQELLKAMRQPGADVVQVKQMLSTFSHRVSFAAEDQAEIKTTLLHLLRLIMENISELSLDDRWLKGQVEALMSATMPPITLRRLDDVERRLRDVMFKQAEARGRAVQAQEEMRVMQIGRAHV